MTSKKILFCRSGGGMPGLDVHAGIWRALEFAGIFSTNNHGTSAGAITAAFDSAGYSAKYFSDFILRLSDDNVRKERFAWKVRIPWINSFLLHEPIIDIARKHIPIDKSKLDKPLAVWATKYPSASAWNMLRIPGVNVHEAVLASMSIPGVFPPVEIDGEQYFDGGCRKNLPLPLDWRDYDEVWLLVASAPPESYGRKSGMLTALKMYIDWLCLDQNYDAIEESTGDSRVKVIWPNFGHPRGTLHFDHALEPAAFNWTIEWLKKNYTH